MGETYHTEMDDPQEKTMFERSIYHNRSELHHIFDQRPSVDNCVLEVLIEGHGSTNVVLVLRVEMIDDFHCI